MKKQLFFLGILSALTIASIHSSQLENRSFFKQCLKTYIPFFTLYRMSLLGGVAMGRVGTEVIQKDAITLTTVKSVNSLADASGIGSEGAILAVSGALVGTFEGGITSAGAAAGSVITRSFFGKPCAPIGGALGGMAASYLCTGSFQPIINTGLTAWTHRKQIKEYFL